MISLARPDPRRVTRAENIDRVMGYISGLSEVQQFDAAREWYNKEIPSIEALREANIPFAHRLIGTLDEQSFKVYIKERGFAARMLLNNGMEQRPSIGLLFGNCVFDTGENTEYLWTVRGVIHAKSGDRPLSELWPYSGTQADAGKPFHIKAADRGALTGFVPSDDDGLDTAIYCCEFLNDAKRIASLKAAGVIK